MAFGEKILSYKCDIIKDLNELISIPSYASKPKDNMPYGECAAKALNMILKKAKDMGFETVNVDNFAGHAEYGLGNEIAAVITHVDVVPAGDGWETEPFKLTVKDGKLFGRGIADNKGAAIVALYCLKVLKDENVNANRRLRVIFGSGEEVGMDDMRYYFEREPLPNLAFTPDSDYGICNSEKGILQMQVHTKLDKNTYILNLESGDVVNAVPSKAIALLKCENKEFYLILKDILDKKGIEYTIENMNDNEIKLIVKGIAAHAACPEKGLNAVTIMINVLANVFGTEKLGNLCEFINENISSQIYGENLGISTKDKYSGNLTLNVGKIRINENECYSQLDVRYPVTKNGDKIFSKIKQAVEYYNLNIDILHQQNPLFIKENEPIISLLKSSYEDIMHQTPKLYYTGGGTYARTLNGKGVAFGPVFEGEEPNLHNINENLDKEKFMLHAQICLQAMYNMITK